MEIFLTVPTGLNSTRSQPLTDDIDATGSDINVFASDCEITVTDADAGRALITPPIQEIYFFTLMFMELLNRRNAFAKEFWANTIVQTQVWDYYAQIMNVPEATRLVEILMHQILNSTLK
ncbi:MAG: hypothetical protein EZS28_006283 [Streblomastix strix]|uniref:Uncharacterized protein n=1 Tax=Streblomastix strix TaxID=222440 RepID=A0A5J4WTA6_9EUKA|nr:MAG: hypothetical protein EZS28_006283 [Streblomastix strix]